MSAADGLTFTPWPHASMPGFSLPALEAAKCVAKQGPEMFERVHLALFRAYFTESRNIGDVDEVARIVQEAAPDVDMARFVADRNGGIGRHAVASDYETALAEHAVNAIPAVIVPATGRRLVGLADALTYRALLEEAAAR